MTSLQQFLDMRAKREQEIADAERRQREAEEYVRQFDAEMARRKALADEAERHDEEFRQRLEHDRRAREEERQHQRRLQEITAASHRSTFPATGIMQGTCAICGWPFTPLLSTCPNCGNRFTAVKMG